jgi:hypothetical protein
MMDSQTEIASNPTQRELQKEASYSAVVANSSMQRELLGTECYLAAAGTASYPTQRELQKEASHPAVIADSSMQRELLGTVRSHMLCFVCLS